jgi:hypothetical protein
MNKDYAIQLLAKGIPTSQVAAACGVDDSYISQLKSDPAIQQKLAELSAASTEADIAFDDRLEEAEAIALERIYKNLPFANMGQSLMAFRILNSAQKRKQQTVQGAGAVELVVNITLPQATIPQYITNQKNEIVEVEGRTMISASAKTLDQILAERAAGRQLPVTTAVEKAATALDNIKLPARVAPRKSPLAITAADL